MYFICRLKVCNWLLKWHCIYQLMGKSWYISIIFRKYTNYHTWMSLKFSDTKMNNHHGILGSCLFIIRCFHVQLSSLKVLILINLPGDDRFWFCKLHSKHIKRNVSCKGYDIITRHVAIQWYRVKKSIFVIDINLF